MRLKPPKIPSATQPIPPQCHHSGHPVRRRHADDVAAGRRSPLLSFPPVSSGNPSSSPKFFAENALKPPKIPSATQPIPPQCHHSGHPSAAGHADDLDAGRREDPDADADTHPVTAPPPLSCPPVSPLSCPKLALDGFYRGSLIGNPSSSLTSRGHGRTRPSPPHPTT